MDYEKKYKEALERAKKIIEFYKQPAYAKVYAYAKEDIPTIFPELAESEDEKIRKVLLAIINDAKGNGCNTYYAVPINDIIAWLEKQGELKSANIDEPNFFDDFRKSDTEEDSNKVKPKFKIGDWITDGEYTWKITDIRRLDYILQSQNGDTVDDTISYVDEHFHLWTIDDAKDGDVLYINNTMSESIMIYKSFNNGIINKYASYNKFGFEGENYLTLNNGYIIPTTKEQRDLLFQKMNEAGYEWDVEKKKLKKIEQNPAWSDEDELMFTSTINSLKLTKGACDIKIDWLKSLKNRVQPQQKQEWSMNDERILYNIHSYIDYAKDSKYHTPKQMVEAKVWLDSLKNRVQSHWKPTEKQLGVLQTAMRDYSYSREYYIIETLYNDLKKL